MKTTWDSGLYEARHSFVWKYGADLLPLLDPQPGERILDIGCGTGQLTAQIADRGAHVVGLDNSTMMIGQARQNYPHLEFHLAGATNFAFDKPFDAVFSNAALHWISDAEAAVRSIAQALKPGGRFVAEFGGKGNIRLLLRGLLSAFHDRGIPADNTFFFPAIGEYAAMLDRHGLETRRAELFDRFTPLEDTPTAMREWLQMFKQGLLDKVPARERAAFLEDVEQRLRPDLFRDGRWHVDYRRIRVTAVKTHSAG